MIKTYFHIDRANSLEECMVINLSKDSLSEEYKEEADQKLFPNGVSMRCCLNSLFLFLPLEDQH